MPMIRQFESVGYMPSGRRTQPEPFRCIIRHVQGGKGYPVYALSMPNNLSPDSNANRRVDVLRCPLRETSQPAGSTHIFIEIMRGDVSLINFTIPWVSRRTGYLLESPKYASNFDFWKQSGDYLHVCVPGFDTPPTARRLALLTEFIQHHLLLGVDHFYFPVTISWDSQHMAVLLRVLKSYIDAGNLMIVFY